MSDKEWMQWVSFQGFMYGGWFLYLILAKDIPVYGFDNYITCIFGCFGLIVIGICAFLISRNCRDDSY